MDTRWIRVLIVEDYEPFRRFFVSELRQNSQLKIIAEVSDGLEGVQKAQLLQPDLVLLDIGLPTMNGIEAARQIRKVSPASKILFVSENRSVDIVKAALSTGASGYVVKSAAAGELLRAIAAVVEGKRYLSARLSGHGLTDSPDSQDTNSRGYDNVKIPSPQPLATGDRHAVGFYSSDRLLLDQLTVFVGTALSKGSAAIVAASELHRDSLLARLHAYGLDVQSTIEEGRYIALDAADALSRIMSDAEIDPARFMAVFDDLIPQAAHAAQSDHPRVVIFGECVSLLWEQGNAEAAIQMEELGNVLTKRYDVNILCGYSLPSVQVAKDNRLFQRICAEHSAVHTG